MLLPLRAAACTGIRVAAYRLRALSQIGPSAESDRTFSLFSRDGGLLRIPVFYLTQPHLFPGHAPQAFLEEYVAESNRITETELRTT